MSLTVNDISRLDVQTILAATKGCLTVPSYVRRAKDRLTRFILDNMSPELSINLEAFLATQDSSQSQHMSQLKCKCQDVSTPSRKTT